MDVIEYNGIRYTRNSKMWTENGMIVSEIMQDKLNHLWAEQSDLGQMTVEKLIGQGDQYKASNSMGLAVKCYKAAFEKANLRQVESILPRLTSAYRIMSRPQDAIDLLTEASKKYGRSVISGALLTSAAAAYCDMGQYDLAKQACDRAYAQAGGSATGELSAVYGRIRRESPITTNN